MGLSFGNNISVSIFGASHASEIGVELDGFPEGVAIDADLIRAFLSRRAPGRNRWSSARNEEDAPVFLSGFVDGVTDGRRIKAIIKNRDVRSADYASCRFVPRPGHADYASFVKYGKILPGGGAFSGRMTAPLCIAGGICIQYLASRGIAVRARVKSIGGVTDESQFTGEVSLKEFPASDDFAAGQMKAAIEGAMAAGDSLGGVVECVAEGLPPGLGGPLFDGLESQLSSIVFAIPAVKGVEFGSGFASAAMRGSENNDPFAYAGGKVVTRTNNCGGILGGVTDGMPVVIRVAFKPVPSISIPQESVDLVTGEPSTIKVGGRHDGCIVPRAVPCVEAAVAIALVDAMLAPDARRPTANEGLLPYRRQLDQIDGCMTRLYERRMRIVEKIAEYKKAHGLAVLDSAREGEKLDSIAKRLPDDLADSGRELYKAIMALSKDHQASR